MIIRKANLNIADKAIVYSKADGTVAVCHPVPASRLKDEPEDVWLARIRKLSVPADARDVAIVATASIPTDRTFREAWRRGSGGVTIDMSIAKEAHRRRLRKWRMDKLAELDVEYQRADERADEVGKREIVGRKQKLRDIPKDPRIAAAQTPEQLKAVTIEGL